MSLLQRTNQLWKVWTFGILLVLGCTASLLQGFFTESLGNELAVQIAIAGMGLIVASLIFAGGSITCPKCELKLFLHAFRQQGFFTWFSWVMRQETCPRCGHPDTPRKSRPGRKVKGLKRP